MENAEPIRRTSEIEDITNLYFIHPIASRLTPLFAKLHIPPNAVSLAGMAFGILAGIAYNHYQDLRCTIAGFILMIAWHVMDGADGQLARLTNSQSQSGKILDGICDYVTFIAVYTGLALTLSLHHGGWVWLLVIVSGMCHAVQSAAYEVQRQEYNFWGRGQKSAELVALSALPRDNPAASPPQRLQNLLYRLYTRGQFLAAGVTAESHKKLATALAPHPEHAASIRRRYRDAFAPAVRRWSVLSSNYRTLGIFICALLHAPLYYFVFEIFGFSPILVVLLARQHARYVEFFKTLATVE
jgi:phosphatidylserine synthase